jgi:hypothetical protein
MKQTVSAKGFSSIGMVLLPVPISPAVAAAGPGWKNGAQGTR